MKGYMQWNPVYSWKDYALKWVSFPEPADQQAMQGLIY